MDVSASASVAATPRLSKLNRAPWSSSRDGYPPAANARPARGQRSASAGVGEAIPSKCESFITPEEDEGTSPLAAALIGLGYSVEYAHDGQAKLATILANRPNNVVLCVCSTARLSDLGLLERFSEANSQRRALPPVLLMGQPDGESTEDGVGARDGSGGKGRLTVREKDVLTWVARGKTSAEIAIILGLSERTINFHCDKAMKRLDVINRTQAVATAIAEGLIGI